MPNRDNHQIAALRKNYQLADLDESSIKSDPMEQFSLWFNAALESEITEPNAMILSTVSPEGSPSSRTVLLKGLESDGFIFFTNYESEKGRHISNNKNVAILFLWLDLERQVRITGKAVKLDTLASETYFKSRPVESQIGAWASSQSEVVPGREYLEEKFESMKQRFTDGEIPLPPFWGGYKVVPSKMEFWQGRPNRLHDRILYTRDDNEWKIERLSP